MIGKHRLVYIDEAQRIPSIGLTLKIIADRMKEVQLLVGGSSAFDQGNEINGPLTGRKSEYLLLPVSRQEWQESMGYLKAGQQLEQRLIYGMYPEVLTHPGEETELLRELASGNLYKDILALSGIKKPEIFEKGLQALALQLGGEVSYNERAQSVGADENTVSHYIEVLEKAFIIFRLPAFGGNIRNEIRTNRKVYVYDNGIRNAVIRNYAPLALRQDKGALWENFILSERVKRNRNMRLDASSYFRRNVQQQEIDYVETVDGQVSAFEIKWDPKRRAKLPASFKNAYDVDLHIGHRDNFRDFICGPPGII